MNYGDNAKKDLEDYLDKVNSGTHEITQMTIRPKITFNEITDLDIAKAKLSATVYENTLNDWGAVNGQTAVVDFRLFAEAILKIAKREL